jgi:uncharacterized protein (TIGR02246 family)
MWITAYAATLTFLPAAYAVAETEDDMRALITGSIAAGDEPASFLSPTRQVGLPVVPERGFARREADDVHVHRRVPGAERLLDPLGALLILVVSSDPEMQRPMSYGAEGSLLGWTRGVAPASAPRSGAVERTVSRTMPDHEEEIRTLIERWATAVHRGDMDGVLADHADDIVMFDVPPPYEGVRGLDAYRETWPPFFEWQAQGASFEIVSLEVTAGEGVAYAHALLRCGTPQELADQPANRLRLTLGLRKEQGRWLVAHEHHSFPDTSGGDATPAAAAEREDRQT